MNLREAEEWYRRAAARGHATASNVLSPAERDAFRDERSTTVR
jgi:hypothetical protein